MNSLDWRRVESNGVRERRHTVYWIAQCGTFRLTVARVYNDDGSFTPGGPWRWTLRTRRPCDTCATTTDHEVVLAHGQSDTVQGGKRQATEAMFSG